MMTGALGRPIIAGDIGFHEWAKPIAATYTDHQLELLAKVHAHYSDVGLGGNSLTLRAALQREPRSLLSFIRELARASRQGPSGAVPAGR